MKKESIRKPLEDINTVSFIRGNGLSKSMLDQEGRHKCILYGHLYTLYKNPSIKDVLARTNVEGKVLSKKGDVLVPGTTTADALGIAIARSINESGVFLGGDINVVRTENKEVLADYVSYYLNGPAKLELASYATGTNILHLSNKKIKKIEIPIPRRHEQKQIVVLLDKVFAAIEKAKANVEKNLRNTHELFEGYLRSIFNNNIEGWEEKRFGELMEVLTDYHANGSYKNLKENVELKKDEDYAWMVRSTDFEKDFNNDQRYISKKSYDFLSKSKVYGGEIIISKIGNAGKVYLMPKIDRPCSLAMNLFLIRLKERECLSEYVYWYLKSASGRKQIESRTFGASTQTITKDNVKSIEIPVIPIKKQQAIVRKLHEVSRKIENMKEIYNTKLSYIEELKTAILQKAFTGNLKTSEATTL